MSAPEPTPEPTEQALKEAIAGFTEAAYARDVERTGDYLADDFQVVFTHPAPQVVDRASFLGMLPDFHTDEYTVSYELNVVDDHRAVNYKKVYMRSRVRGVERNGDFTSADYWLFQPGRGWAMWQRFSTPLSASTLPDA